MQNVKLSNLKANKVYFRLRMAEDELSRLRSKSSLTESYERQIRSLKDENLSLTDTVRVLSDG